MNRGVSADVYSLAPMQAGMLFQSLYSPQSGVDIEQMVCSFTGINISALQLAWDAIWHANEELRVSFDWQASGQPLQQVHASLALPWDVLDWQSTPNNNPQQQLDLFLRQDRQRGFNLARPPLMRLTLICLPNEKFWLVWTFHHILLDGRAIGLLFRQLAARLNGEPFADAGSLRYRAYVAWLEQQDWAESATYWREQLRGFASPTPLGLDRPQPALTEGQPPYNTLEKLLSPALTAALRLAAEQHGLTLNTFVQAAWAILLHRYSGEKDIVFGIIRTGRRSAMDGQAAQEMIGLLINTLPLRTQISPQDTTLQLLQTLRANALALRGTIHEHIPLTEIQKNTSLPSGARLFESILAFESEDYREAIPARHPLLNTWGFKLYEQVGYPLVLAAYAGAQLRLNLEYSREHFDDPTARRILAHLETALESMVADLSTPLWRLSILDEVERRQLLVDWNNSQVASPGKCVQTLIEAQAREKPEQVALVFEESQLTYAALNQRANQLAHYLRKSGIQPGAHVAVCTERGLEMIVYLLAVLKAGGVYIPLDPEYPVERLAFMLEDAEVGWLLTQPALRQRIPSKVAHIILPGELADALSSQETDNPPAPPITQPAYILYTSGSTGKPKGVVISHDSLATHIESVWRIYQMTPQDRMLQFASISFDTAMEQIFDTLVCGATLVLRSGNVWSIGEFRQNMLRHRLSIIELPPLYLYELLLDWAQHPSDYAGNALRIIFVSGEKTSPQTVRLWQQLGQKHITLLNSYGPTEATIGTTLFDLTTYAMPDATQNIPIGRPLPGRTTYILDEYLQPVPIGAAGELHIGGAGLALGYYKRPALTTEKFIANPFGAGRLYKTGDLASYLPDGNIEFLGRVDHQVKIRGFRIELGEIEAALEEHPGVRQAVAAAREINGQPQLAAYVTTANGGRDESRVLELRSFLQQKLPAYMIPSAWMLLEQFPLSPNGKIDRRALPEPSLTRLGGETFAPPQTETEEKLAGLWSEILNIQQIGRQDHFFHLGGHSLLATRLFARLRETFGIELPLRLVFEAPVLADLAQHIENALWASVPLTETDAENNEDFVL